MPESEQLISILPATMSLFPIAAGVAIFLFRYIHKNACEIIAITTTALTLISALLMYVEIIQGKIFIGAYQFFSFSLTISFRADALTLFLGIIFSGLWFLCTIFSPGYLAGSHARDRYYAFLLLAEGGCLGTVFAADLLGLFLFFEFMALSTYVLIVHEEKPEVMFAGAVPDLYLTIAAGMSVFLGLIFTYYLAGTISLSYMGIIKENSPLALLAFGAFLVGFGIKTGLVPLHIWLPDAHPAAPAPVSALLSGIMLKTGVYGLIRVYYNVFGLTFFERISWQNSLLVLSGVTILFGSALALLQDNLKRRLAYSSITQIGYITLGVALLSERALLGALYHLFTHALMKGLLFLCAGAIISQTGKHNISELKGIGRRMPRTMFFFAVAAVTIVGIPPFNGFTSKWQLSLAALETGQPLFVGVLILSSLLNALYYFPVVIQAFFAAPPPAAAGEDAAYAAVPALPAKGRRPEAPWHMLAPMAVLAAGCVVFAFLPVNWPLAMVKAAVRVFF